MLAKRRHTEHKPLCIKHICIYTRIGHRDAVRAAGDEVSDERKPENRSKNRIREKNGGNRIQKQAAQKIGGGNIRGLPFSFRPKPFLFPKSVDGTLRERKDSDAALFTFFDLENGCFDGAGDRRDEHDRFDGCFFRFEDSGDLFGGQVF